MFAPLHGVRGFEVLALHNTAAVLSRCRRRSSGNQPAANDQLLVYSSMSLRLLPSVLAESARSLASWMLLDADWPERPFHFAFAILTGAGGGGAPGLAGPPHLRPAAK